MKEFTIFWKDGKRDVLKGSDVANAFTRAGYGAGALGAVDFYSNGNDNSYEFDSTAYKWISKK